MATISGKYAPVTRVKTGLHSFDWAFENDLGEIGMPIGTGYEIFGSNGIGKSTFTLGISGLLGRLLEKDIAMVDFERFDGDTLIRILDSQGFTGNIHLIMDETDEDTLDNLRKYIIKDEYSIGILDSVAAISSMAEQQGDLGEANMGRRAFLVAQFSRKLLPLFREEGSTKTMFLVNHWYPKMGTRGYDTPGGEAKKYLCAIRVQLKRKEVFPDHSYVLEGYVYKNRYGYEHRSFYVFMLAGPGLHAGLTAMWDCLLLEKAERKRGGWIAIGDTNVDRLSGLVKSAKEGNNEVFEPFFELLKEETEGEDDERD